MDEWVRGDDGSADELRLDRAELDDELAPYPVGGEEVVRVGRRHRFGLGLAIVAAVLLIVGVVAVRHDRTGRPELVRDDDAEVADVTQPDTTVPEPDVPDASATQSLGLGSPIDGKESLRLPVRVVPDTGLVDGQRVTVKAEGFPPNVRVGVVTCTIAAMDAGVAACDIFSNFEYGQTDLSGRVTITYTFRRFITIANTKFDCLQGNIDPKEFGDRADRKVVPLVPAGGWNGCLVAVGMLDDYDQSGGWPVLMQGATAVPMPEGTTAAPSTPSSNPAPTVPPPVPPSTRVPEPPTTTFPPSSAPPTVPPETIAPTSTSRPTVVPAPGGSTP